MKIFVEGGGDSSQLKANCRKGFASFFEKAGLKGKMPRIVASGSRKQAYDDFCTALNNGEEALLLVDSEESVNTGLQGTEDYETWKPWEHLAQREGDKWLKPANATNKQCHLMVQCMESWFLADHDALKSFFGQGFQGNQLPTTANQIETIGKQQVYDALAKATANCKTKAKYGKGEHSFKILERIAPSKVIEASPWARRWINVTKQRMGISLPVADKQ